MQQFDHPNVLKLTGVCMDGGPTPFLVMPFMANGSLYSYLKKERRNLVISPDKDCAENEEAVSCTISQQHDLLLTLLMYMQLLDAYIVYCCTAICILCIVVLRYAFLSAASSHFKIVLRTFTERSCS